ncbi:hypothetical protein JCM10213_004059 [Rhodosporidiobolus nylandii]
MDAGGGQETAEQPLEEEDQAVMRPEELPPAAALDDEHEKVRVVEQRSEQPPSQLRSSTPQPERRHPPARSASPAIATPNPFARPPVQQCRDPVEGPPPKPVTSGRKRAKAQVFFPGGEPDKPQPDLSDTVKKAAQGVLFKHRATVKSAALENAEAIVTVDDGAECNVVDAEWFQSWRDSLGLVLQEGPPSAGIRLANNSVQRLLGLCTLRIQVGLSEELVSFRVLDSGGAIQILLGKPWKAQIGAVHFYELDLMMHKTTVQDRWSCLWNQNPKAAPKFTTVPRHPAALARFLEDLPVDDKLKGLPAEPQVLLLAQATASSVLEQARLTPLPDEAKDDGLLPRRTEDQVLLPLSGLAFSPASPKETALALRRERWRRELQLHPRTDLFPGKEGPAFLSRTETERVLDRLDALDTADFWAEQDGAVDEPEWESWSRLTLPPLEAAMLKPSKLEARREQAKIHLFLVRNDRKEAEPTGASAAKTQEEHEPEQQRVEPGSPAAEATDVERERAAELAAGIPIEPPMEYRRREVRKLLMIGDKKMKLSDEQRARIEALVDESANCFALSLSDVKATPTVKFHIPTPGAVPTRARNRPFNNPDQQRFVEEYVDKLLNAQFLVHVHPDDVTWVSSNTVVPKANRSVKPMSPEELQKQLEAAIAEALHKAQGWAEQRHAELGETQPMKRRLCHAFLDLNDATVGAPFPVGDLDGKVDRLAGNSIFSAFDMESGYAAIEVAAEDIIKTTFAVPDRGYFAYRRMPFGLKGAPAAFCDLISTAFKPYLGKTMEAWMDDLATASNDFESHLKNVRHIFETCREHKLSLNPSKCHLFASEMVWCGIHISAEGKKPDQAKVRTVVEWPTPRNPHEVLRFLNFAGYYRSLIKNYARIAEPLTRLTRGVRVEESARRKNSGRPSRGAYRAALKRTPKDWEQQWGVEQVEAFNAIRRTLTSFPVLRSPNWTLPFVVETDASVLGMGAVLAQDFTYEHPESGKTVTNRHPIAFISRATRDPEKRYSAFLLELVGVKWALEKSRKYLYGRPIELVADCQALAGILLLQQVAPTHARWRDYILGHDIIKFTHRPGKQHQACDELSRREQNYDEPPLSPDPPGTLPWSWVERAEEAELAVNLAAYEEAARRPARPQRRWEQIAKVEHLWFLEKEDRESALRARFAEDPFFQPIVDYLLTLQVPPDYTAAEAGRLRKMARAYFVALDGSLRKTANGNKAGRECIPLQERDSILTEAHSQANHAGRERLLAHIFGRFYWPGMSGDCGKHVAACERCQQFGPQVFRSKVQPVTVLKPMQLVSVDYFSLPRSHKFKSVLVAVDYFSRYVWTWKFHRDGTGAKTVKALQELGETFGFPEILLSDNGSHFDCAEVRDFCRANGVQHRPTPTYLPHTNGLVKRANQLLLRALERECAPGLEDGQAAAWPQVLHKVTSRLNDRVVSSTGYRPLQLMFGYERRVGRDCTAADLLLSEALDSTLDQRIEALLQDAEKESRQDEAFFTLLRNQGARKEKVDAKHALRRGIPAATTAPLVRGDLVLVHSSWLNMQVGHKLQSEWTGPYRIVARASDVAPDLSLDDPHASSVTFWLDDPLSGAIVKGRVHMNRLKKAVFPEDELYEEKSPLPSLAEFFERWKPERSERALTAPVEALEELQPVEEGVLALELEPPASLSPAHPSLSL